MQSPFIRWFLVRNCWTVRGIRFVSNGTFIVEKWKIYLLFVRAAVIQLFNWIFKRKINHHLIFSCLNAQMHWDKSFYSAIVFINMFEMMQWLAILHYFAIVGTFVVECVLNTQFCLLQRAATNHLCSNGTIVRFNQFVLWKLRNTHITVILIWWFTYCRIDHDTLSDKKKDKS